MASERCPRLSVSGVFNRRKRQKQQLTGRADGYLSSYQSIESGSKDTGPEFGRRGGRRRADSKLSPVGPSASTSPEPDALTPAELLMLNALVFKDVKTCYQLVSLFFRDAELIPGDPSLWEDRDFHSYDFLCNPFVSKSMLSTPPFLSTVCIIKSPLVCAFHLSLNR